MSAIDVLAAAGFVNYFGKVDLGSSGVGQILLHPVLIKKVFSSFAYCTMPIIINYIRCIPDANKFCYFRVQHLWHYTALGTSEIRD
jgi:hypothetical protein